MSEKQRESIILDLTTIIDNIQSKLNELVLDLDTARKTIELLKEDSKDLDYSDKAVKRTSRLVRRQKREKEVTSKSKAGSSSTTKEHVYKIGDRIRILNPTSKKQTVPGTVLGYTKDRKVKFELDNKIKTNRKSKNLELL